MSVEAMPMNEAPTPSFRERLARALRGLGPLALIAFLPIAAGTLVVVPLGALLVVLWTWLSRTPWRGIGYVRPKSWLGGLAIGIVSGVALKFLMKAVVMPLLGADPVNHAYHCIVGNPAAVAGFAGYAILGAGWGEETVFRGYLFERLGRLLGSSVIAKTAIVVLTSVIFAPLHFMQGWPGIAQAAIMGFVFATVFAVTGRLFSRMITHAAFDLTAAAMIYFDAESKISHLFLMSGKPCTSSLTKVRT